MLIVCLTRSFFIALPTACADGYGGRRCCSLIGGWCHMLATLTSLNGSARSGTPVNVISFTTNV